MVKLSVRSVQVSSRGRFANLMRGSVYTKKLNYYTVFGGGFPMQHFKSLSQAREVAVQRRKFLAFNLKKDRNKLYRQK